jgi:hypothetical protein
MPRGSPNYLHPDYGLWSEMRRRCNDPKRKDFPLYGGSGIRVCERWGRFLSFIEDMGPRPSREHSIDRIDGTKGYSPDNCRWATPAEQGANRRTNFPVTINGTNYPSVRNACLSLGLPHRAIAHRLEKGMAVNDAFSVPIRSRAA